MTDMNRRTLFAAAALPLLGALPARPAMSSPDPAATLDALDRPAPMASNGARWTLIEDGVMGGRSDGAMTRETVAGRAAVRLRGDVSLENNGGFIQMALDADASGDSVDASHWTGLEVDAFGNDEDYNVHLRLSGIWLPWQAFRATFRATSEWRTLRLPFAEFEAYRTDRALDLSRLRRVAFVAIGREFTADLAIGGLRFYA